MANEPIVRFTTRAILACVVLGGLGAVLIHASRLLGLVLQGTLPWLAFPAPLPWVLGILIAPLLTQRVGAALLTSAVTAIIGFGGLALCAGVVVEAGFQLARWVRGRSGTLTWPPVSAPYWLIWALILSGLTGIMNFGFMFLFKEFLLLDPEVKLLALGVRVVLGVLYGWLSWLIARALLASGVNPQRVTS